jgi:hypothetical protein
MHLMEGRKRRHVRQNGAKMIKVLVQLTEDVEDEDVNAEVDEGVGEALHLEAVVVQVEIALNKVSEGGVDVEGVSLPIANGAILQCQPGSTGGEATLTGDVLKFRRDSAEKPRLDQHVHRIPSRNIDERVIRQYKVREGIASKGEQHILMPVGMVRG